MARPSDATKDRELIRILTENAPPAAVGDRQAARRLRATAQGRLSRLERDGVIAGYTTILGKASRPATTIAALIMIELEMKQQGGVVAALKKRPEIVQCHTLSGHFDSASRSSARPPAT